MYGEEKAPDTDRLDFSVHSATKGIKFSLFGRVLKFVRGNTRECRHEETSDCSSH